MEYPTVKQVWRLTPGKDLNDESILKMLLGLKMYTLETE